MRFFRLYSIIFCMFALVSSTGCSKGILKKEMAPGKTWTCDKEADEAMRLQDYETSILLHQLFLKKEPENGLALYHLGYALGQTGNHEKEVFLYEKAVALGFKESGIFFNLGMAYGELNQMAKSITAFRRGIKHNPGDLDVRFELSRIYYDMDDFQNAEDQLRGILEIDPTHGLARELLERIQKD